MTHLSRRWKVRVTAKAVTVTAAGAVNAFTVAAWQSEP